MFGLEDRVILVTGGNRGIGAAVVTMLANHGAKVAYTYRSHPNPELNALALKADVTDPQSMEAVAEEVDANLGPVYGVVANAGITNGARSSRMSYEKWATVIDTNLNGVYNTLAPIVPGMYGRARVRSSSSAPWWASRATSARPTMPPPRPVSSAWPRRWAWKAHATVCAPTWSAPASPRRTWSRPSPKTSSRRSTGRFPAPLRQRRSRLGRHLSHVAHRGRLHHRRHVEHQRRAAHMTSPYPGFNPKAMEAWFTLMAEAMRGAQQAQQAFDAYARMTGAGGVAGMDGHLHARRHAAVAAMDAWVEEWQKMLGVVAARVPGAAGEERRVAASPGAGRSHHQRCRRS
ncbi:MAG: SDR family NAD(P)-dependent oxidoreductase [Caldilineaceae bacterium]